MLVRDVMSTPILTCAVSASLDDAVAVMLDAGAGSVIVVDADTPVGIVTETDIVAAGFSSGRQFADIAVEDVMSHPLTTIDPDRTLRSALERMRAESIKKLPVVDDLEVIGIVTLTDVVYHYGDLRQEVFDLLRAERDIEGRFDRFPSQD